MIEYPPQTSLPLIPLGWKCLLDGKLIESCSHYHTMRLVGQMSYKIVYTYRFIQVENVVVTIIEITNNILGI